MTRPETVWGFRVTPLSLARSAYIRPTAEIIPKPKQYFYHSYDNDYQCDTYITEDGTDSLLIKTEYGGFRMGMHINFSYPTEEAAVGARQEMLVSIQPLYQDLAAKQQSFMSAFERFADAT